MHRLKLVLASIALTCTSPVVATGTGDHPLPGIALNNGHFFRFNNDIRFSFDLTPARGHGHYLAYLARVSDPGKHAVDLLLNTRDDGAEILVISGEKLSKKRLDANPFTRGPVPLSFHFDLKRDQLSFTVGDTVLVETRLGLRPRADYKVSLGSAGERQPAFLLSNIQADPDIVSSRKFSKSGNVTLYWVIVIVALDLVAFVVYVRGKRRRRREEEPPGPVYEPARDEQEEVVPRASAVFLLGEFRVLDRAGRDVSRKFTPLVKELFLILLLYSRRDPKGISPDTLREMLWLDKETRSANNNRAVNIGKLKAILDTVGGYEITSNSSVQRVDLHEEVSCDYYLFSRLLQEKSLDRQQIARLVQLARRGPLLPGYNYEWLDAFKADLSGLLVDTLVGFAAVAGGREEPRFMIQLADTVSLFDPLNEDALHLKCKSLIQLGKHSLASATYTRFSKEYERLYGVTYNKNFPEISRAD
jgi:DNA-binding SARP family transcriptional activator